jgi:MarC family integral membrane protein
MIAGGVLLFIVAIELLTHGVWRFGGGNLPGESAVVPLAFSLLAGPGSISSVMISYETSGLIVTILSIAIVIGVFDPIIHKFYLQVTWETWFYDSNKSRSFYSSNCRPTCSRRCQRTFHMKSLRKKELEQVGLTPLPLFYFFFAAFTGFFAFVFLTILNIKIYLPL